MNDRDIPDDTDTGDWLVLVNAEGQHALWPVCRPAPPGWNETGPEGRREDCLGYIERQWADMRPLSAREGATARP